MSIRTNIAKLVIAGAILCNSYTVKWLNSYNFSQEKIYKVMVIPGHDNRGSGGCEGRAGKESNIVARVGSKLEEKLKHDENMQVFITRDEKEYNKELVDFIEKNFNKLKRLAYEEPKKHKFDRNNIDYLVILYGIAKYANDNGYDLMINLHVNALDKKTKKKISNKISGFSVWYSPLNKRAFESKLYSYFNRNALLADGFKPSNNKGEKPVNECSKWVLVGNHKIKLKVPSNLIELDYISQKKLADPKVQKGYAEAIYKGTKNYFRHHKY